MSMINIGISSLKASQVGLKTTSHNISNASVAGYSRQVTVQSTASYIDSGGGFIGQGTVVEDVRRQYDEFLDNQIQSIISRHADFESYSTKLSQISNMLADPEAGMTSVMENFFQGVHDVAANPSNIASRQTLISAARTMVDRFSSVDRRIDEIRDSVESEIGESVTRINELGKQIGLLNEAIMNNQFGAPEMGVGDLLDQRTSAIEELTTLVNTRTTVDNKGMVSVYVANSHALVNGKTIAPMKVVPDPDRPDQLRIGVDMPTGEFLISEDRLTGGKLSGLMRFRNEVLESVQGQIGIIARSLMEEVNAQHALGVDLNGNIGKPLFVSAASIKPAATGSVMANAPTVTFEDVGLLEQDGYRLTYDSGSATPPGYTLTRLSDGSAVADPASIGLDITLAGGADGDAYFIEPVRNAVKTMGLAFTDPRMIAAANPIVAERADTNTGNSTINAITIERTDGMMSTSGAMPFFSDISISYAAGVISIAGGGGGLSISPATYDPATESAGKTFSVTGTLAPNTYAFTFSLNGVANDGDSFTLKSNESGAADNRNAIALSDLQIKKTMLKSEAGNNTANFQTAYGQLVVNTASQDREAKAGSMANAALLDQTMAARESVSGVNLDEEASNLLLYQQAYQASAKIIQIAQTMFDEIVSIVR